MRRDVNWVPRQHAELAEQAALEYMRGQVLRGELRGWGVATWRRRPLGWLKGDGRQLKNHLPKAGRMS
jgi:NOL1/NOP2/fmu family ribosome biogenesis protein